MSSKTNDFLMRLGCLVVYWNRVEESARYLIYEISRQDRDKIDILTAHMGSTGICDALRTLSNEYSPKDLREHFLHFIYLLERLREYRNYYVHGMLAVEDGTGYIQTISARSQLTLHRENISLKDLDDVLQRCLNATDYAGLIVNCWRVRTEARRRKKKIPSLPDKPPLPDRLKKPRRFLLGD